MQNQSDSLRVNSRFSSSGSSLYFPLLFWYEYGDQRSKIHNKMLRKHRSISFTVIGSSYDYGIGSR